MILLTVWYTSAIATTIVSRVDPYYKGKLVRGKEGCFCDHCGDVIQTVHTFPVTGYLMLRGKTKCCEKPIPRIYLWVEISMFLYQLVVLYFLAHRPLICAAVMFGGIVVGLFIFCVHKYGIRFNYKHFIISQFFMIVAFLCISMFLLAFQI